MRSAPSAPGARRKRLAKAGTRRAPPSTGPSRLALAAGGLKLDEKNLTQYLLFLGEGEIARFADLVEKHFDALAKQPETPKPPPAEGGKKKTAKKDKAEAKSAAPEEVQKAVPALLDGGKAADLALFGRMLADLPEKNVDAACQVAHAISTNKIHSMEMDYYTAVDDINNDNPGADMIGTVEFNSACFYRYATLDVDRTGRRLPRREEDPPFGLQGDAELARTTAAAFLKAFIHAIPTGKQNSFAAHNKPSLVFAVVRDGPPVSLANAFVKPVTPRGDESLVEKSIEALDDYYGRLVGMYGDGGLKKSAVCQMEGVKLKHLKEDVGVGGEADRDRHRGRVPGRRWQHERAADAARRADAELGHPQPVHQPRHRAGTVPFRRDRPAVRRPRSAPRRSRSTTFLPAEDGRPRGPRGPAHARLSHRPERPPRRPHQGHPGHRPERALLPRRRRLPGWPRRRRGPSWTLSTRLSARPVWPLFLGRKSFVPSLPVSEGVFDGELICGAEVITAGGSGTAVRSRPTSRSAELSKCPTARASRDRTFPCRLSAATAVLPSGMWRFAPFPFLQSSNPTRSRLMFLSKLVLNIRDPQGPVRPGTPLRDAPHPDERLLPLAGRKPLRPAVPGRTFEDRAASRPRANREPPEWSRLTRRLPPPTGRVQAAHPGRPDRPAAALPPASQPDQASGRQERTARRGDGRQARRRWPLRGRPGPLADPQE